MMGERELRVLSVLDSPKYVQEVADELDYRPDTIYGALSTLEELGLVHKHRQARGTLVEPAEARVIEVYQSLTTKNPHVDFPDLLTNSMLDILYYLPPESQRTVKELKNRTGYSNATIYRNLRTLTNRAMALKEYSQYRLTDEFNELHRFAYELRHHAHRSKVTQTLESGTIVWESHNEFLVRTDGELDSPAFLPTGLDAFSDYGLEFYTTSENYYFYTAERDTLSPADLVCHIILIENDSRHRKYALLLIAQTNLDQEELEHSASYYGIEDIILQLFEFLNSRGKVSREWTPDWEEFQSLVNEYEVDL